MKTVILFIVILIPIVSLAQDSIDTANWKVDIVEEKPAIISGESALHQYISENTQYPPLAREKGLEGIAHIEFTVESTGLVTNVALVKSSGHNILDQEALRVIKSLTYLKPGNYGDESVRVIMTIPIEFKLNHD